MSHKDLARAALQYYNVEILDENENQFIVVKGYQIEIERNGLYKLLSDGQVIAPFDDVDDLCRFILL